MRAVGGVVIHRITASTDWRRKNILVFLTLVLIVWLH
jgi:hypothetical protein